MFQCFYGVGKRVGQLEWVVEIIGTTRSLFREVREMGGSELSIQVTNYGNSDSNIKGISELNADETTSEFRWHRRGK